MTNREIMDNMLNNINDDGMKLLIELFGNLHQKERYNVSTTPERIEEIEKKYLAEKESRKAQQEDDRKKSSYEASMAEYKRREDFKASLAGREKRFFEVLETVTAKSCYYMAQWEMRLLADTYKNNLIDGSFDIFRYGFMKGQRAEINRRKRIASLTKCG